MRQEFFPYSQLISPEGDVLPWYEIAPWANTIVPADDGYMAFESEDEAREWEAKRVLSRVRELEEREAKRILSRIKELNELQRLNSPATRVWQEADREVEALYARMAEIDTDGRYFREFASA